MVKPSIVVLEFLTWLAWLACFAVLQGRLCARYPGIRLVCRKAYVYTMIVPIAVSIWLMARFGNGPNLFAVLNHGFGAGVFAQTFLRSVVLLKWLLASGIPHQVAIPGGGAANVLYAQGDVLGLVGALQPALRKPAARGPKSPPNARVP